VQDRLMVVAPVGFANITEVSDRRLKDLLDVNLW
jgi:hypothetical protein